MKSSSVLSENSSQLVSFTMHGEEFAFPIHAVREIVRLPEVTPVPGAPGSVNGIINLRGSILPLIDLRKRFNLDTAHYSEDSRVMVIRHQGHETGMIVDRVNEVLRVQKGQVDQPPADIGPAQKNGLQGIARIDDGRRVVMILSEEEVLPPCPQESLEEMAVHNASEFGNDTDTANDKKNVAVEDENLLISFILNDEEFAVNITEVREIVRLGKVVRVPRTPAFFLGVMSLRNALLPVIDLRIRFGLEGGQGMEAIETAGSETDSRRVIVADIGGVSTGLLVTAVSEVLRLSEKDTESTPEVIDKESAPYIRGVGKLDEGNRLLMLVDLARLLSCEEKETLAAAAGKQQDKGEDFMGQEKDMEGERQLVCFRIADEEYGIDIMQVREIIRIDTITLVPGAPPYVSGIVNLRGNVLPVIDLRCRFGRDSGQRSEQNRILVVEVDGRVTGLIVDAVSEVLRIPESCIESTPGILKSGVTCGYITGIGKLDGGNRAIIMVDVDAILDKEEIATLPGSEGEEHVEHVVTTAAEETVVTRGESGLPDTETKNAGENMAELVIAAVENAEEGKENDGQPDSDMGLGGLMKLKKDELLAKAKEIGIQVDARKTKKQIAGLIIASMQA